MGWVGLLTIRVPIATGIEWAVLRDGAWKEARAAYSYEEWERSQHVAGKAPRTILHYAYTLWDLLETHPAKDVDEFTADDCTALLLTYPQRSRGTRAAHLVSYFKHLRRHRRIPENPMELVELPKTPKRRLPDIFTDVEIAALEGLNASPDGPLFTLMFECGLRKGECRKLRRRDINLVTAELLVRQSFAYRWRLSGLAADELQIILGHSSVQTTVDQYGHLSVNDVAKRMREIEAVTA